MPGISINLVGDGAFDKEYEKFGDKFVFMKSPHLKVARLPTGTDSGKSAVHIGFEYGDHYIVVQTTLLLMKNAIRAMEIRDEMEGRPR